MLQTPVLLLSDRVLAMEESATLKMAKLARQLRAKGHDVIALSLGEPDFDTPDHIKEAAKKALDAGFTKYTPVPGLPELREAICRKFKNDNDLDFDINQIVVSNGAKQSIANLCMALLNNGDEAIIFAPYWVSYSAIIKVAGGIPIPVKAGIEQDFKVTPDQLKEAITDKTRIVLFSSPCNPTGSVYTYGELQEIAKVISLHPNITVISDEIYEHINFTGKHVSIGAFEEVRDRTVTVNGFSKGFAMTGWRLGYIGAPQAIASACAKIQGQNTSGATSFGQKAAAFALDADMAPTHRMREAFFARRDIIIDLLDAIPGVRVNRPTGAFYVFPNVSAFLGLSFDGTAINSSDDLAMYLLTEAHVATVAGSAFGDPECIRISYAASEEQIREAILRISNALAKLS
jgi:aspartate aminotransferase